MRYLLTRMIYGDNNVVSRDEEQKGIIKIGLLCFGCYLLGIGTMYLAMA